MNQPVVGQRGFTLIELLAMLVLLGILAISAVPRLVEMQTEARASTLGGVKTAIQGAGVQVFAKSLIVNKTSGMASIDVAGTAIATVNGYPDATVAAIAAVIQLQGDEIKLSQSGAHVLIGYDLDDVAGVDATCAVRYAASVAAGAPPEVSIVADDC